MKGLPRLLLILVLVGLSLAAISWIWHREALRQDERRSHYRIFMREAWQTSPRALTELQRLHAALDALQLMTDEVRRREELFEYARLLDARLRQSTELERRMVNLFPPPDFREAHDSFLAFIRSLRDAETCLRQTVGNLSPRQLEAALAALDRLRQALGRVPLPETQNSGAGLLR